MRADLELARVDEAIREVAARVILPRFRKLLDGDVTEKGPGDLVTVADVEAERELTRFLSQGWPGATVIGEEAVAADPTVLTAARSHDRVWVIDPIDGTRNFVAGSGDFAVMIVLVEGGRTSASWIYHPVTDQMFTAVRGDGARVDGAPLVRTPAPTSPGDLNGVVVTGLLEPEVAARVEERALALGPVHPNSNAAGIQYLRVAQGELDYVLYWRTLVWDHAPGALLLEEAGALAARLDGEEYQPWSTTTGLILAADPATHARVRSHLAPDGTL